MRYQNCCFSNCFILKQSFSKLQKLLFLYNIVLVMSENLFLEVFLPFPFPSLCCSKEIKYNRCFFLWKTPYIEYKWNCTKTACQNVDCTLHNSVNYWKKLVFPHGKVFTCHLTG